MQVLIDNKADLNKKDNDGFTALMVASLSGNQEIVDMLIKSSAAVNTKSKQGNTPLTIADIKGHGNVADKIKKAGGKK